MATEFRDRGGEIYLEAGDSYARLPILDGRRGLLSRTELLCQDTSRLL
jgi:hypothetical protein